MRSSSRFGFTLVELLVVITIIGILIGLLMPAVNAARESGRRAQCMNNVKQLAAGCIAHESAQGFLPSGGWGCWIAGEPDRGYGARQPGGWIYNCLPYMDYADLHDMGKGPNVKSDGRLRAQTAIAVLICPTRRKLQNYPRNYSNYVNIDDPKPVIGRSDYAACAGDMNVGTCSPCDKYSEPLSQPHFDWRPYSGSANSTGSGGPATGVIFRASQLVLSAIKDGPSFTYLLGERYLEPDFYYRGDYCANDQGWDQGYDYDTIRWTAQVPLQDRPGYSDNNRCDRLFGSAHASGFHMAFCDGSVRKLNYNIDPLTHKQLGNRMDGQPTQLQKLY